MNITSPIVVDLGKAREESIRQLQNGVGQLVEDVQEVVSRVRSSSADRPGRVLVPVVVVYDQPEDDETEPLVEIWQSTGARA